MSDEPSGEFFDAEKYQNPQQDWVCGHHAGGNPCPIGPNGSGECLVAKICVPEHDGSEWHCTRARAWGGRCKDGPVPDAEFPDQKAVCPHQPAPCQPDRSLRNKRRLVTGVTAAAALGCCLVIFGGSSGDPDSVMGASAAIISPGPLSAHHGTMNQGCVACHSAASASPLDVLNCAFGGHDSLHDSEKCLECHKNFGDHAMFAHSLDPADLAVETERVRRKISGDPHTVQQSLTRMLKPDSASTPEELACSMCHQEHRGAEFDLKHLTNSQCQSCHTSSFHSFAHGHEEFTDRDRAFIHFNHVTHLTTHFPNQDGSGDQTLNSPKCTDCHIQDASGTSMILNKFENMCANCHSSQITDDHMPIDLRMPGTPFISLNLVNVPIPDSDESTENGDADSEKPDSIIDNWPGPAADSRKPPRGNRFDELPPFMEIMLSSDADSRSALNTLRKGRNPGAEISAAELSSARQAFADSIRRLIDDLVDNREQAVTKRIQSAPGADSVAMEKADGVAKQLAASGFYSALRTARTEWFPASQQNPTADKDPDTDSAEEKGEESPSITLPAFKGAWEISDDLTLSYRCWGHGDPFLRDWISFAAAAASQYPDRPDTDTSGAFDRMFRLLVAPEATGRCMKCHTVDGPQHRDEVAQISRLRVNWKSRQVLTRAKEFTRFAHGPHVTLLNSKSESAAMGSNPETRCVTCHGLLELDSIPQKSAFRMDDWMPDSNFTHSSSLGVKVVERASCVKCHTPKLAGDNCLQCHNYHVHPTTQHGR